MNINEWVSRIHGTAVSHGWWPEDKTTRNFGEMIALDHSELSEAFEAYRTGKCMVYTEGGKPEGVAVECIDCVIRILDTAGAYTDDFGVYLDINATKYTPNTPFEVVMCCAHEALSKSMEEYRRGGDVLNGLAECCNWLFSWLADNDMCINSLLETKCAYNETRPYRHGGKRA